MRRRFRINNQGILPIVEKVASALKNSYGEIILKYEPEALNQFLKEFLRNSSSVRVKYYRPVILHVMLPSLSHTKQKKSITFNYVLMTESF